MRKRNRTKTKGLLLETEELNQYSTFNKSGINLINAQVGYM